MISEGQIVLFKFPQTDQQDGKLRPALVLRALPGQYDDWLICMILSQLHRQIVEFDDVISPDGPDFVKSGLRLPSLIRLSRLAVVERRVLLGSIGQISSERLVSIKKKLVRWISGSVDQT